MKSNAPEKLYYAPYGDIRENHPITDNDIEYIRKDVFIEKACDWLKANITNNPNCDRVISRKGVVIMGELIKDFKKAMML